MSDTGSKIHVGVVGRAHGIRGAIRVFTDDAQSDSLLKIKAVYIGNSPDARTVKRATRCGRFVALEIEGIEDRDAAFELTGQDVYVDRSRLRPLKNAYYTCDLIGLSIVDETGHAWGEVDAVMPSGAHDLLRYKRIAGGFGLVPFVAAHVGKIDLDAKTVQVESAWMSELDAVYGE